MNIAAFVILILIVVIMILREKWKWPVFQYLFLCRVPLFCGLLLLGLAPIAIWIAPDLLGNLLILSNRWGFFAVALVSVITGNMVLQVGAFVVQQAPARIGLPPLVWEPKKGVMGWLAGRSETWTRCVGATLLALPLNVFVGWNSWPEFDRKWILMLFLSVGVLAGLGLLLFANLVFPPDKIYLVRKRGQGEDGANGASSGDGKARLSDLFKGYSAKSSPSPDLVEHRHLRMTLTAAGLIAVFLLGAVPWKPGAVPVPALFFVVFLILVYGYVMAALAFFLDRYRVPLLLFVLWATVLLSSLQDSRHYYQLFDLNGQQNQVLEVASEKEGLVPAVAQKKISAPQAQQFNSELFQALERRLGDQQGEKVLVAFAVTGGGIQAAGWTAQVLTGLYEDERFGPEFIRATGLISSVSGGTVGSMFFLDRLDTLEGNPSKKARAGIAAKIRESAMGNSLPDVAWSLAYQDSFRLFGLNWLVSKQKGGRGWALEESFRLRLANKETGMRKDWLAAVRRGELPLPVFNSTLVESGDRLLISPFVHPEADRAQSMAQIYPDRDLNIATAARLSATFPFVSPLASPIDKAGERVGPGWHVADGGYFDTYGMFTLVEWLNTIVLPNAESLALKKVLIVQINAFPPSKPKNEGLGAWQAAVLGPVRALVNVRVSTQEARNQTELCLLKDSWSGKGVEICNFDLRFKVDPEKAKIDPQPDPPYSWKLSKPEKLRIGEAWQYWRTSDQSKELLDAWRGELSCRPCRAEGVERFENNPIELPENDR